MKYTIQDIEESMENPNDLNLEKAHAIFRDLKEHVENNGKLELHEIEHFCNFEFLAYEKGIEGYDIHKYQICKDYWFEWAYREYWNDLHGIKEHEFPLTGEVYTKERIQSDLQLLSKIADDWELEVETTNHSNPILQDISKETRIELKNHKKKPIFNDMGFFRRCNKYNFEKLIILLRSKYIYLLVQEFFHIRNTDSLHLKLGKRNIEFTPYSLIHVLSRHYEMSMKQVDRDKSFHFELIEPRKIFDILKSVFNHFDDQKLSCMRDDKIYFQYEKFIFTVWIEKSKKQIKGSIGNFEYERIASFYPTQNSDELKDIELNYSKDDCSETICIYYKIKTNENDTHAVL